MSGKGRSIRELRREFRALPAVEQFILLGLAQEDHILLDMLLPRKCKVCGKHLDVQRGRGRKRSTCESCAPANATDRQRRKRKRDRKSTFEERLAKRLTIPKPTGLEEPLLCPCCNNWIDQAIVRRYTGVVLSEAPPYQQAIITNYLRDLHKKTKPPAADDEQHVVIIDHDPLMEGDALEILSYADEAGEVWGTPVDAEVAEAFREDGHRKATGGFFRDFKGDLDKYLFEERQI